jgi:hypothetical protein
MDLIKSQKQQERDQLQHQHQKLAIQNKIIKLLKEKMAEQDKLIEILDLIKINNKKIKDRENLISQLE